MKKLVCIGDSLTEGADLVTGHTWPSLVGNALNLDVANFGIGGDTTQGMLSRFYPEVLQMKPDYMIVMGGTNDLWWDWDVKTILGNIFSILYQARYHNITPVLGLPLPFDPETAKKTDFTPPLNGYERMVEKLDELVGLLEEFAAGSEIPVIDLHRPFFDQPSQINSTLFLEDGLHPNHKGHQLIADKVIELFRDIYRF